MRRSDGRGSVAAAQVAVVRAVFVCAAMIGVGSVAHAESLPASIRACAQEPDSLKRLICFDQEVARYSDQAGAGDAKHVAPPPPIGGTRDVRAEPAMPSVRSTPPREDPSDSGDRPAEASAPKAPKHIAAKVATIQNFPDAIVVHLDNGQVWEQVQEGSADLNLRAGDPVTIDRELGSYWLSGKSGEAVKVRQKK